jgi:hypothetical protein
VSANYWSSTEDKEEYQLQIELPDGSYSTGLTCTLPQHKCDRITIDDTNIEIASNSMTDSIVSNY